MYRAVILSIVILSLFGCSSVRALKSARITIDELEQLNEAGSARNSELAELIDSEREGNKDLERIIGDQQSKLNKYIEAERNRLEAEKLIVESLSGIFVEGSNIIEELIRGYNIIREYFETQEPVE